MIMKLALLAVLYCSAALAETCQIYNCASSLGATCGSTAANTYTQCTGSNQYCNTTTLTSNGYTGACANKQPGLANGQSCSTSSSCNSDYCRQDGVCANDNILNNQACKYNADCQSQVCTNNVCVGAGLGASCTQSANCNNSPNLFCSTSGGSGTCTAYLGINAACTSTGTSCVPGLFCSPVSNKCVAQYSAGSGAVCSDDYVVSESEDQDDQCGDGLTCIGGTSSSTNGKCAAAPASSGKSCGKDSDCTAANEHCVCNFATGSGTCKSLYVNKPTGASAAATATAACFSGPCSSSQTESCAETSCKSGYCAYLRFSNALYSAEYPESYPACLGRSSTSALPSFCNSASSVAMSAFVVVAAVAALVM